MKYVLQHYVFYHNSIYSKTIHQSARRWHDLLRRARGDSAELYQHVPWAVIFATKISWA